ncbi:MAG TPA: Uma2 family endonuclease [Humisphaera sp.]|jgi:Uma2 family endonuclease|nr:Uma2 family endonuclease [Humisphaera sp.]
MSAAGLKELVDHRAMLMPITVDQYYEMIGTGILPEGEPYELLDGFLVRKDRSREGEDPMTVGDHHAWVITMLTKLNPKFSRFGCYLRLQLPIEVSPNSVPEPDGAIVVGTEDDYREQRPSAAEVTCVIEVSDSSLQVDRLTKQRIYANAGIPQYIIINLRDLAVEVYTAPAVGKGRYGKSVTLSSGTVDFSAGRGKKLSVPLRSLLP